MKSFFVRPLCSLDDIRQQFAFLMEHGFSGEFIERMSYTDRQAYIKIVVDKLKKKHEAQQAAAARSGGAARARVRFR